MSQSDEESSESPGDERPHPAARPKRRSGWLPILLGVLGVFALVGAGTLWLLANLDHRVVKGPVERMLSELVGTEVRYEGLSLSPFSGLQAKDLVLATPEALRAYAPELLRFDELRVRIDFAALLSGNVVIPELRGGAVELTVVFTDDGRNSISELFPPTEQAEEASAPLSQSLESLRELPITVGPVELAPLRLRALEVAVSEPNAAALPTPGELVRQTELAPLGIFSEGIAFAPEPNASISLRPQEEEVVLTVEEPAREPATRRARLSPAIELRLANGRSLTLHASAKLLEQSLFPEFQHADSLLRLHARVELDPTKARTIIDVEALEVLDSMLIAKVHIDVQDAVPPQDGDEQDLGAPPFSIAQVEAEGAFDVPALPWSLSWLRIDDLAGRFEVAGLELAPAGVTAGHATLRGTVKSAHYEDGPLVVTVDGASLNGALSAPKDPAQTFGALTLDTSVDEVRANESGVLTATVQKLAAAVEIEEFGPQDSGMWGLKGTGSLTSSIERASARMEGAAATIQATLAVQVDLAEHQIAGSIPVESLSLRNVGQDPIEVRDAEIDFAAQQPTHWATTDGSPSVELTGSVARVSAGPGRFRAPRWSVKATRTAIDHYAVDASVTAERVSWGDFRWEPPTRLSVRAAVDTKRPAVDANAVLAIAGSAPTRLSLKASHDAPTTRYAIDLVGAEAGPLLGAILFGDGGLRSDELAFSLQSQGAFRGLVSKNQHGELVLSEEPLRTLRGSHRTELHVDHLSLLRFELTHQIHDLTVIASSSHQAPGKGALHVSTAFARADYGQHERPMSLHHYAQELEIAYAALYGAPSFVIETDGTIGKFEQPYLEQYPVADVSFGVDVDVDESKVYAVRELYWRNPAGGTRLRARASYEGWSDAIRSAEVCSTGTTGCPKVASMYGREAAKVSGTLEQDFRFWQSTERTKSGGSLTVPFTIESGDLNTYRVLATAQFRDLVLELPQYGLLIEDLDALIPMDQEITTEPELFVLPSKKANAMAQMRFFDLYPFTQRESFFTVGRIQFGPEVIGPVAANLRVIGPAIAMDQIHAAYRKGFITGQFLADLNRDHPNVAFRGHITGIKVEEGKDVLDANLAMTFVPTTLIVEGKAQLVRISKDHLYAIIDAIDPYHEDEDMNRVRLGLKFGYPKYIRVNFEEGLMDTKIDLGGLAGAIRIDEIKGVPVTPFLEQYVQPYIERIFTPFLMYEEAPPDTDATIQVSERSGGRP